MTIIVVRSLGPGGYGVYAYALSVVTIGVVVAGLGMDQILIRDMAESPSKTRVIVGAALRFRLSSVLLVGSVIALIAAALESGTRRMALIVALPLLVLSVGEVFESWFQSRSRFRVTSRIRAAVAAFNTLTFLGLAFLDSGVLVFLGASSALTLILVTLLFRAYRRYAKAEPSAQTWQNELKRIIREGWPMAITATAVIILFRVDIVMLALIEGTNSAGIYGAGARVSEVGHFVPIAIAAAFYPSLVSLRSSNPREYDDALGRMFRSVFGVGLIVAIGGFIMAPLIVDIAFGASYSDSVAILRIHLWSFPFVALAFAHGKHLVASRLIRPAAALMASGAFFNIILNIWLIPIAGPAGAAWSTVVSYAWIGYFGLFVFPATRTTASEISRSLVQFNRYLIWRDGPTP